MRIPGMLALAGLALLAPRLAAQEHPKPIEKPKAPPKPAIDFSRLKFMEGCWEGNLDKDQVVEELWTTPSENLMLALTRYLTKRHATGFEFTRIEAVDTTVVFAASSDGKPENVYTLKTLADEFVVFENLAKKEFPQRIIYRMASDGALIPRNEGDGPSIELRFHRVKCPGADIKLRDQ